MGRPRGKAVKLEDRRQEAMDLIKTGGLTAAETARRLKIHDRTVRKWLAAYRKSGTKGLVVKVSTGRPKKLEVRDLKKLQKLILRGSVKAGFSNELWTSKRVLQVIRREFGVDYHANHLPRLLRSLGFTPQRPQREAAEKDQKQIKKWIRYEWTRIKKKPAGSKPPSSS
jgi:transposase